MSPVRTARAQSSATPDASVEATTPDAGVEQVEASAKVELPTPQAQPPQDTVATEKVEALPAAESEAAVPEPAPEPEPAPAPEPEVEQAPEEEPAPEEESGLDKFLQKFTVGAALRTGLDMTFSGEGVDDVQLSLHDGLVDQIHIRPFMSGTLTENLSFFTQFEVGTPSGLGTFAILDAIAQIKFVDEFQLWVGQHIPANDRNNMNGPFFGNTWNFAIAVPSYGFDVGARDRGFTFWGLLADGILKYHLSMVDLQPGQAVQNSRFGGRLTLNLLEPENYYYASGSYWGGQDTLAIGAVYQYQQGVGVPPEEPDDNDFNAFSFDLFFEKNFGSGGTLTLEGGYWNWENVGADYVSNQGTVDTGTGVVGPLPGSAYLAVASWLTPEKVGLGKIQVNARFQYGDYDAVQTGVLDLGLAYVVDGFNHKYHINYRHVDADPTDAASYTADSIQLGAQLMLSH